MISEGTILTRPMLDIQELDVQDSGYAHVFQSIDPAVDTLYICSDNLEDLLSRPRVAIVGTRRVTPYGRGVTEHFARELARQGIVIVSGLAYGVDQIAHQAALDAGGLTIAVLPGSLSRIYPARHTNLAQRIIGQGGALISEYPVGSDIAYKNQFVERNRIVSGMSDVLLITEASADSGTMHTATFANNQGKHVLAIPGNITSSTSRGTNNLLKLVKASPACTPEDVIEVLGLTPVPRSQTVKAESVQEHAIISLLKQGIKDGNEILLKSSLAISEFNHALTMMELTGKIRALGANQWALR